VLFATGSHWLEELVPITIFKPTDVFLVDILL
jgi:hypothetical protein